VRKVGWAIDMNALSIANISFMIEMSDCYSQQVHPLILSLVQERICPTISRFCICIRPSYMRKCDQTQQQSEATGFTNLNVRYLLAYSALI
jgi:hypothetical protein